jgi:hypothetical protein
MIDWEVHSDFLIPVHNLGKGKPTWMAARTCIPRKIEGPA